MCRKISMLDLVHSSTVLCIVLLVGHVSGYTTGSCSFSSSHDTCGYTLSVRWTIYEGQYRFHNKVTLISDGKGDDFYAFFDSSSPFEQLNRTGALQGGEPRNTSYDMTSLVIPPGTYRLSYWYILPATQSDLHVLLKPVNGTVQTELFSKYGKEDYWDKASVEINSTEAFQISFRGYRWAYGQFIGIDNILVEPIDGSVVTSPAPVTQTISNEATASISTSQTSVEPGTQIIGITSMPNPYLAASYTSVISASFTSLWGTTRPTSSHTPSITSVQSIKETTHANNTLAATPHVSTFGAPDTSTIKIQSYTIMPSSTYKVKYSSSYKVQPSSAYQNQVSSSYQNQATAAYQYQASSPYQNQPSPSYQNQPSSLYQHQLSSAYQNQVSSPYQNQATSPYKNQATSSYQQQATSLFQNQASTSYQYQSLTPYQYQNSSPNQNQVISSYQYPAITSYQNHASSSYQYQPLSSYPYQYTHLYQTQASSSFKVQKSSSYLVQAIPSDTVQVVPTHNAPDTSMYKVEATSSYQAHILSTYKLPVSSLHSAQASKTHNFHSVTATQRLTSPPLLLQTSGIGVGTRYLNSTTSISSTHSSASTLHPLIYTSSPEPYSSSFGVLTSVMSQQHFIQSTLKTGLEAISTVEITPTATTRFSSTQTGSQRTSPSPDHSISKKFFCKRCSSMEYCVSLQKYQIISQIECYKMGMNLAQKEKADGTELIATLTSCQLPLPVVNGESEYLVHGTGDGDTSSPNCKRTYVRQQERRSRRYYFTDELACYGATTYPYVCERELPTTPTTPTPISPTTTMPTAMTTPSGLTLEDIIYLGCTSTRWNITVDMARLRQLYPNASRDNIFFGDTSCSGREVGDLLLFQQGLRECLTSERISEKKLIYENDLLYAIFDPQLPIIRNHAWTFSMECDVSREEVTSTHVHHEVESHHASATTHYDVKLEFFKDPNFNEIVPGNPLHAKIGDEVYVKVFTTVTDWTIKMHVHTCYTKPGDSSQEQTKYYLIKDGCEMDRNTHIISQSTHETRFVFQDFEYPTNHEGLNIFCDATFCKSLDYSTRCLQVCNPGTGD